MRAVPRWGSRVGQVSSKMYYLDDDALVSGHEAAPHSDNKDTERQESKGKGPDKGGIVGHGKRSNLTVHVTCQRSSRPGDPSSCVLSVLEIPVLWRSPRVSLEATALDLQSVSSPLCSLDTRVRGALGAPTPTGPSSVPL